MNVEIDTTQEDCNSALPSLTQSDIRRGMLGELISLYYTTFLVSVRSLNIPDDIFSMEELFVEIEDHIV